MKKLLMIGAILAMGAMAYGADAKVDENANVNEATVTVKAKLVAENLVISDLEGNPIVLDFGRVSKTRASGTSEAKTGYMVRYVGEKKLTAETNNTLRMYLDNKQEAVPVLMSSVSQASGEIADTFEVSVGLDTYSGVMPVDRAAGHDYPEFTGVILGTLNHDRKYCKPTNNGKNEGIELKDLVSGDYLGTTTLKVTLNDGNDFSN